MSSWPIKFRYVFAVALCCLQRSLQLVVVAWLVISLYFIVSLEINSFHQPHPVLYPACRSNIVPLSLHTDLFHCAVDCYYSLDCVLWTFWPFPDFCMLVGFSFISSSLSPSGVASARLIATVSVGVLLMHFLPTMPGKSVSRWCTIIWTDARFSIRWCVCMLWGKCGTGAGMWVALTDI